MTLIRRLSLCLLALALLPGATLQARMASTVAPHAITPRVEVADTDCHEAMPAPPPAKAPHEAMQGGHADGAGAAADCCGDAANAGDCGNACPCPTALAALPLSPSGTASAAQGHPWRPAGLHGRDRFAEGPPSRPPIG